MISALGSEIHKKAQSLLESTSELHRLGNQIYENSCTICHGATGQGNGSLATEFTPRLRNFTFGNFKFSSTGSEISPTREDLVSVSLRRRLLFHQPLGLYVPCDAGSGTRRHIYERVITSRVCGSGQLFC